MGLTSSDYRSIDNFLLAEYGPGVIGVLIGGSNARGTAIDSSDVDVFAMTVYDWRQRRRYDLDGMSLDLFIYPEKVVRSKLTSASDDIFIENFAYGLAIADRARVLPSLQAIARKQMTTPRAALSNQEVFVTASRLKDSLRGLRFALSSECDAALGRLLLYRFIDTAIATYYLYARRHRPALRRRLADLASADPHLATLLDELLLSGGSWTKVIEQASAVTELIFSISDRADDVTSGPKLSSLLSE